MTTLTVEPVDEFVAAQPIDCDVREMEKILNLQAFSVFEEEDPFGSSCTSSAILQGSGCCNG
jgi:hypothetical protein